MSKLKIGSILTREVHQSWGVVALAIGVIAGMVVGLVTRMKIFGSLLWAVVAMILFLLMYIKPRGIMMGLVALAGMMLGLCRVAMELDGQDYISGLVGKTVTVTGKINGDPVEDEAGAKLKLAELEFGGECDECEIYPASGNIYVSLGRTEGLSRGDSLTLNGKLSEGFGTYAGYLYRPKVARVKHPEPGDVVIKVRNWFAERVRKLVPEPEVGLGLSYLLGMKTGLTDELAGQLRVVGLTHIVVASGAHLSILVEVARKIFGKVSRAAGLMCSVGFILFFMSMVGWTPSIMRAGMMAILTLATWYVGRKIAPWRIILLVAAVTLMVNPMFAIDVGWLLSFASYAGIMLVGPKLTRYFYGKKKPGFIGGTVLTTVAATVMTLPMVLYFYGQVSLISVVANLVILPTLSWAMGLTFLTGVAAGVPGVETAVSWCATKMLDFHMMVVGKLGEMRWFLVEIETGQRWTLWLYAIIVGWFTIEWAKNRHRKVAKSDESVI